MSAPFSGRIAEPLDAATRARDLLVAPVTGDQPIKGWLDVLNPMLYPQDNSRRHAGLAPGCPEFGEDSVLDRGAKGRAPPQGSVRPGLQMPVPDGPAVAVTTSGLRMLRRLLKLRRLLNISTKDRSKAVLRLLGRRRSRGVDAIEISPRRGRDQNRRHTILSGSRLG
jgi:hypothetical protein